MKTKVFISWSGEHSRQVALSLHECLHLVVPGIDPWMSEQDINKGERWNAEIAKQLDESSVGVLCIVPDNRKKPWLLFEAGALAKSVGDTSRVCPFLHHLKPTDIEQPLGAFQATVAEKNDVHKLLKMLNDCCGDLTTDAAVLDAQFEMWWPQLERQLGKIEIPAVATTDEPRRTDANKTDEILSLLRHIKGRISSGRFAGKTPAQSVLADMDGGLVSYLQAEDRNTLPLSHDINSGLLNAVPSPDTLPPLPDPSVVQVVQPPQ